MHSPLLWLGFNLAILFLLFLDLKVVNQNAHQVSVKESLFWTSIWIGLALIFNIGIYFWMGPTPALQFLTGYVVEYSLSVDNLFVFIMVFTYFKVPAAYQHKVLFYGILGALIMRVIFIFAGVALLEKFEWMVYIFGGILIISGIRFLFDKEEKELHLEKNLIVRLLTKYFRVSDTYHGDKFFFKKSGIHWVSPLFIVVLVVEMTDLMFAVDSIPAILAITTDPFLVYTSNVFAILGLRSLYFSLAGIMGLFHYLKYGLALILIFVGIKIIAAHHQYEVPTVMALGTIVGILALSILLSLWKNRQKISKNDFSL